MKIIFMGTPDFAVPCLEKLIHSRHEVVAVFSQPDKPVGRKQILTAPPVKACALENNIPVFQPEKLKTQESVDLIKSIDADIIVVVAYGKILSREILECKKYGCINVHASLLPKYRGAAPIQWSILKGDSKTGVSVMKMNEGLDTGDIILTRETDIDINENAEQLFDRLSLIGADALADALDCIENASCEYTVQDEFLATYSQKITKELSPIDWSRSAKEIHNQVRGLYGTVSATTTINSKGVKIHKTQLLDVKNDSIIAGSVVDNNKRIVVCCGDGSLLEIKELQPEGKKRMDSKSFLSGNKTEVGSIFGE